ncbi:unnamed protein product [Caenorhabditis bovis]|uniref:Histone-lysine N-methyltransferase n=1 Tax=Caenorhabditis bovis TaxID=2654633 RepID=A0A8S1F181_9PELO|nr:unnamed protein product [Caenorhabditis bovis]
MVSTRRATRARSGTMTPQVEALPATKRRGRPPKSKTSTPVRTTRKGKLNQPKTIENDDDEVVIPVPSSPPTTPNTEQQLICYETKSIEDAEADDASIDKESTTSDELTSSQTDPEPDNHINNESDEKLSDEHDDETSTPLEGKSDSDEKEAEETTSKVEKDSEPEPEKGTEPEPEPEKVSEPEPEAEKDSEPQPEVEKITEEPTSGVADDSMDISEDEPETPPINQEPHEEPSTTQPPPPPEVFPAPPPPPAPLEAAWEPNVQPRGSTVTMDVRPRKRVHIFHPAAAAFDDPVPPPPQPPTFYPPAGVRINHKFKIVLQPSGGSGVNAEPSAAAPPPPPPPPEPPAQPVEAPTIILPPAPPPPPTATATIPAASLSPTKRVSQFGSTATNIPPPKVVQIPTPSFMSPKIDERKIDENQEKVPAKKDVDKELKEKAARIAELVNQRMQADKDKEEKHREEEEKKKELMSNISPKEEKEPVKETKKVITVKPEEMVVPPYEYIQECKYLMKPTKKYTEGDECHCFSKGLNCSDNSCDNVAMNMECPSSCRAKCKNQRFAKRKYASVEAFHTGTLKGCGLRACKDIKKGKFIIEYVGEMLERDDYEKRKEKYASDKNHKHHYLCDNGQYTIDATRMGNPSRFINHSCEPNAVCQKWSVPKTPGDVHRIGFFAKRNINAGEEITFDYQFANYGKEAQECFCGAPSCTGWIGSKPEDLSDDEDSDDEDLVFNEVDESEEAIQEIMGMNGLQRKEAIQYALDDLVIKNRKHAKKVMQLIRLMTDFDQKNEIIDMIFSEDTSPKIQIYYANEGMFTLIYEWLDRKDFSLANLEFMQKLLQVLHGEAFLQAVRNDKTMLPLIQKLAKWNSNPMEVDIHATIEGMLESIDSPGEWEHQCQRIANEISEHIGRVQNLAKRLHTHWFNRSVFFKIPKKKPAPETKSVESTSRSANDQTNDENQSYSSSSYQSSKPDYHYSSHRYDKEYSSRDYDEGYSRWNRDSGSYYGTSEKMYFRYDRKDSNRKFHRRSRSRSKSPKRRRTEDRYRRRTPDRQRTTPENERASSTGTPSYAKGSESYPKLNATSASSSNTIQAPGVAPPMPPPPPMGYGAYPYPGSYEQAVSFYNQSQVNGMNPHPHMYGQQISAMYAHWPNPFDREEDWDNWGSERGWIQKRRTITKHSFLTRDEYNSFYETQSVEYLDKRKKDLMEEFLSICEKRARKIVEEEMKQKLSMLEAQLRSNFDVKLEKEVEARMRNQMQAPPPVIDIAQPSAPQIVAAQPSDATVAVAPASKNKGKRLWAKAKSDTGEWYYYNTETKETQWSPPRPEQGEIDPAFCTPPDTTEASIGMSCNSNESEEKGRNGSSLSERIGELIDQAPPEELTIVHRENEEREREEAKRRLSETNSREADEAKRTMALVKGFRKQIEQVVLPLVKSMLKDAPGVSQEKMVWYYKLITSEMLKRENNGVRLSYTLDSDTKKKVRKYTISLLERKLQGGASALWKDFRSMERKASDNAESSQMATKRVTVKIEHTKKTFFEKLLNTMKIDLEDRKVKYVMYNALENLKKVPFEMETIVDLKNVQGIGDNIAVKCMDAWNAACEEHGSELTLKDVKKLKHEDYQRFQNGARNPNEVVRRKENIEKRSSKIVNDEFRDSSDEEAPIVPEKKKKIISRTSMVKTKSFQVPKASIPTTSMQRSTSCTDLVKEDSVNFNTITCKPYENPRVFLIADNREHRDNRPCKSVIEHLVKKNAINVDIRSLSVGDYLWICRKIDGTEIVLDWVVERKTWDDLKSSIIGGRYDEQKARLGMAPMRHRVYLIEAKSMGDVACEQAVASTLSNGGYMIQRCSDTRDTAAFLAEITLKLQNEATNSEICGVPFNQLQNLLKKKKAETVKDLWVRQLMVCPGMSYSRADAIADRFPSMPALLTFFRENGDDSQIHLLHILPQLTRPIIRNLFKFFVA